MCWALNSINRIEKLSGVGGALWSLKKERQKGLMRLWVSLFAGGQKVILEF